MSFVCCSDAVAAINRRGPGPVPASLLDTILSIRSTCAWSFVCVMFMSVLSQDGPQLHMRWGSPDPV